MAAEATIISLPARRPAPSSIRRSRTPAAMKCRAFRPTAARPERARRRSTRSSTLAFHQRRASKTPKTASAGYSFSSTMSSVLFTFTDTSNEGIGNDSYGIDNVVVTTSGGGAKPSPNPRRGATARRIRRSWCRHASPHSDRRRRLSGPTPPLLGSLRDSDAQSGVPSSGA